MRRPIVTKCNPLIASACVVMGLAGCSSKSPEGVVGGGGGQMMLGTAGTPTVGAGGTAPAGSGGSITGATGAVTGTAGTISGNGGSIGVAGSITGTAGTATGSGGTAGSGAAGAAGTGTAGGGAAGGGGGAAGGGVVLGHCDQETETAAKPILQACGDITGTKGVNIKLGPQGAIMDINVGKGFENTDPNDNATCPAFAALFNEPAAVTNQLLDVGTQPCNATAPNTGTCLDFKLYSVYRPAIWPDGKIPVISWANGTCAQPEGYGPLLRYVASYGFFVIAANSREVGTGKEPLHALDFAKAANEDMTSPYYGHLDLTKIGVMGHSQGGGSTVAAANDARVTNVIIFNGGNTAAKPFLAISGDMDITGYTAASMASSVNAAPKAAYLYYHNPVGASGDTLKGHLVLMLTPERVTAPTVAWWQMVFNTDPKAKDQFVGSSCGLCGSSSDYAFGEHGL